MENTDVHTHMHAHTITLLKIETGRKPSVF